MNIPIPWLIGISAAVALYIFSLHGQINSLRAQQKRAIKITEQFFAKVNQDIANFSDRRDTFIFNFAGLKDFKVEAPPDDEIFDAMYESATKRLNEAGFNSVNLRTYEIEDVC
jgi:hypothetical protein